MKKIVLSIVTICSAFAANADTQYSKIVLENGLQAYLIEDHRQPIAVHMIWYKAGSADEEKGKTGLAHLLEHLMFKGTENIKPQEFSKIIAKMGGIDNASTSVDYTNYFQLISTKNLPKAMEMEADRMENLKFSENDFQKERDVVIQERLQRIDNSPWGRFYEKVMSSLYSEMPYKTLTTGTLEDLKNLTKQDALDWYDTYYAPNNAVLIVVGDLTKDEFSTMVNEKYSHLKTKNVKHKAIKPEPLYKEAKNIVTKDQQVKSPTYYKLVRTPSFFMGVAGNEIEKNDIYNLIVLSELLASSESSFLYKELVLDTPEINSISTDYSPIARAETTFDFYIQTKDNVDLKKVEELLNTALNKFITEFNDQEKLAIAKNKIKSSQIYAKDDSMSFARSIGKFLSAGGSIEEYDSFFKNIDNVSLESLKVTADKYFNSKQLLDIWLIPEE